VSDEDQAPEPQPITDPTGAAMENIAIGVAAEPAVFDPGAPMRTVPALQVRFTAPDGTQLPPVTLIMSDEMLESVPAIFRNGVHLAIDKSRRENRSRRKGVETNGAGRLWTPGQGPRPGG
jgi:hypothetical protein